MPAIAQPKKMVDQWMEAVAIPTDPLFARRIRGPEKENVTRARETLVWPLAREAGVSSIVSHRAFKVTRVSC